MASDDELRARAVTAYYRDARDARRAGREPDVPAGGGNVVEHDGKRYVKRYVMLANVNGTLAVYRVRRDGVLKRLRRWTPGIAS